MRIVYMFIINVTWLWEPSLTAHHSQYHRKQHAICNTSFSCSHLPGGAFGHF